MRSIQKIQWVFPLFLGALMVIGVMSRQGSCASFDAFLEIEGVEGESEVRPGAIEIQSYSWGMSNSGSSSVGGGGGAGKVNVQDISFVKRCDKSSPMLMTKCCSGTHIATATLRLVYQPDPPADGTPGHTQYLTYTLSDCLVSSYSMGGSSSGDQAPLEELSLSFTALTFDYARTGTNPAEASSACVGSATE